MGADRSTALVPRILHTADWQIGKPYRWIDDGQKQARLQQERVEVVGRIAEIVRQEAVDAVLVARQQALAALQASAHLATCEENLAECSKEPWPLRKECNVTPFVITD